MVMRVRLFHTIGIGIMLGAFAAQAGSQPDTKPARGTVEYAKTHALYAPRPQLPLQFRTRRFSGTGLFALHIRPEGTVSYVQRLQSTGAEALDAASIAAFIKWRFYPGQFKVVKIPITYTGW